MAADPAGGVSERDRVRALALEQAWRHFQLHSGQRTAVFNFFVASGTLTLSGLVYTMGSATAPRWLGVAAGCGAAGLALLFWKLDQRTAQLVKCAEQILVTLEADLLGTDAPGVFRKVEVLPTNASPLPWRGTWSYGRSFRVLFGIVALLGLAGGCLSVIAPRGAVAPATVMPAAISSAGSRPNAAGDKNAAAPLAKRRPAALP